MRPCLPYFVALSLIFGTISARADDIGLTFSGGSISASAYTRGFEFTTANAITITSLGWWDDGGDGLASSHEVAIWNTSGTELLSGTVQAGTTDVLDDGFRFDSTLGGSTTLSAGTYIIGGLSTLSDYVGYGVPAGDVVLGAGISFVTNETNNVTAFSFPDSPQVGLDDGVFGPDFTYTAGGTTSVTPEPSSLVLLGTGLFGVLGMARRTIRTA